MQKVAAFWFVFWLAWRLGAQVAAPAGPEEARAYEVALKLFQDGLFEVAERECGSFATRYPSSDKLGEVFLLQAQARLKLKRYDDALAVLTEHAAAAGKWADEYAFWQAETLFEKGQLAPAAEAFGRLTTTFPQSPRRLNAAYHEAFSRYRLGETDRAIALLRDPNGAFQQSLKSRPEDESVARGQLLLAGMLSERGDFRGAEETLAPLAGRNLAPELAWEREYLLARALGGAGRLPEAFSHTTNLWSTATNQVSRELRAAAALLQADLLERLQQPDAALQAYERCLGDDLPAAQRRLALQKTIDLSLRQNKTVETVQRLEAFAKLHPQDDALDLVRLTLGELRLKDYYGLQSAGGTRTAEGLAAATNLLTQARVQFDLLLTNHPASLLVGRAQLNRGWCFWEEGTNRLAEGLLAFKTAVERLPVSADQAVARFKWADCQWRLADPAGAISNYWQVATNTPAAVGLTNALVSEALSRIVHASLDTDDVPGASAAMNQLVKVDPLGSLADRAELLVGQALNRLGQPQAARAVYDDFARRSTNSALLPEVKLALAKTYEQERAWPAAIAAYGAWLAAYRNQATVATGMVAQANFDLARVTYRARPDTNALALLTNFVAVFPGNTNAPLAQYLVGEYYFGQGDYGKAELHFQDPSLVQNPPPLLSELSYRARLMAGRSAVARQSYRSARDHFDWIITNGPLHIASSPIPVSVVAEAYLFRGDTLTLEPPEGETNTLSRFGEAINAFSKITDRFPTNEFAPLAWGRIGECHFQLASQDPKRYDTAAEAFRKVIDSPADISIRSQARWKLGVVLEKQAALKPVTDRLALESEALDCYLGVVYPKDLRPGEQPDPYWVKRAGLSAAELAEAQKKWDVAIGLYQRLLTELPPLRGRFEKKIEELQAARQKAGGGAN